MQDVHFCLSQYLEFCEALISLLKKSLVFICQRGVVPEAN